MIAALQRLRRRHWALLALLVPIVVLEILTFPPILPDYAEVRANWQPSEAWLYDRDGQLLDTRRINFAMRRLDWTPLDHIRPAVVQDLIASEDHRFYDHGGVDWVASANALRLRLMHGHSARGASTITMQLAGFLDPSLAQPGRRTWRDKLRQMRAAWGLEARWSKPQIIEAYLNLARFRGETQGVAAASDALFGVSPDSLSPTQARLLVALLPAPKAATSAVAARACRIAPHDCAALTAQAESMTLHARQTEGPMLAPHLAAHLLHAPGARVRTTINTAIQRVATQALSHQLQMLGSGRARDGAVVVLDNATGDVLAYVGGAGGASTAGAVDGVSGYRQAGSTLKPFLYAQAFEKGWLTPASILEDAPVALDTASGLYVPQDYDHVFKGAVSARSALAGSLNVPAVRTLLIVGVDRFRDRLWDLGYHGLTEDGDYYGYSLALGSAEVTLLEQANAYRALVNGGQFAPYRLRATDAHPAARAVVTRQAAWLVSNILADPAARAGTFGLDSALRLPFWAAAKTGTSKAMRDNWCIGYSRRYTVAVWVGNLEGDAMKAVSGTSGAAPVWRDVMLALHAGVPSLPPPPPMGVDSTYVRFAQNIEPPRRDYFLHGTAMAYAEAAPEAARRPHITNPVSGSIFALDPDIPPARQRLGVRVAGAVPGHHLLLDRRDLGAADAAPQIPPLPGSHLLALVDGGGHMIDQVRFTVR